MSFTFNLMDFAQFFDAVSLLVVAWCLSARIDLLKERIERLEELNSTLRQVANEPWEPWKPWGGKVQP